MKVQGQIQGGRNIIFNLKRKGKDFERKFFGGAILAAGLIRRDMEFTPPLVPVNLGNLRGSWFTVTQLGGSGPIPAEAAAQARGKIILIMGFSASYALAVHEKKWKVGKRPGSGPKFLEASVKRNKDRAIKIIAGHMKT